MSRYLVVIERGSNSYGAYVPDLPGCVALGQSAGEVRDLIRDAIALHVGELRRQGRPVPAPRAEPDWADSN